VPKTYQLESIRFGLKRKGAGFFLAPGLGKTTIILYLFKILKDLGVCDELLVLAKRRIVYNVWRQEIDKWGLPYKYAIVHGRDKARNLHKKVDVRITNYETVPFILQQKDWLRRKTRLMLAVDESSAYRNSQTKRFRSLKQLIKKANVIRRYIMTGSPAPKNLLGIFSQMYILDDGATFGTTLTAFRNKYFNPGGFGGFEWKIAEGADKQIFKRMKPRIIRYGEKELDLPPYTRIVREIELPKKARRLYDEMEKEYIVQRERKVIVAANAGVATQKLRQACNGGMYITDAPKIHGERPFIKLHTEKCAELVDLLDELNGEPALVSYEFGMDKRIITDYLQQHAPQYLGSPFIGGKTKDKDVTRYLRRWTQGRYAAMFGNMASVAHGLNLQEGRGGIVIFYAFTYNFEDYDQFLRRIWRQGQKRRVLGYHLVVRNSVDEDQVSCMKMRDRNQNILFKAMERRHGIRGHH
jgi:SNF2 family DNA or RNA helicase